MHSSRVESIVQALHDPRQEAANKYWAESMAKIADQHAQAIANTDYFDTTNEPRKKIKAIDTRLLLAHHALLQQSDTRWGTRTTNDALGKNGHCYVKFRNSIEMAHRAYLK